MAQGKSESKSAAEKSSGAKSNTKSSAKSSTKNSTKSNTKSSTKSNTKSDEKSATEEIKNPLTREIIIISVFALGVLMIIFLFNSNAGVGVYISKFLKNLLGMGAIIVPIALIGSSIYAFLEKEEKAIRLKIIFAAIFVMAILGLIHTFTADAEESMSLGAFIKYYYTNGTLKNAGLVGAIIGGGVMKLVGKVAAILILLAISLIFLMLLTGKSFFALINNVKAWFQEAAMEREALYEEYEENNEEVKKPMPAVKEKVKYRAEDDMEFVRKHSQFSKRQEAAREEIDKRRKLRTDTPQFIDVKKNKGADGNYSYDERGRVMTIKLSEREKTSKGKKISLFTDEFKSDNNTQELLKSMARSVPRINGVPAGYQEPLNFEEEKNSEAEQNIFEAEQNMAEQEQYSAVSEPVYDTIMESAENVREMRARKIPVIPAEFLDIDSQDDTYEEENINIQNDVVSENIQTENNAQIEVEETAKPVDLPPWEEQPYSQEEEPLIIEAEKTKTLDTLNTDKAKTEYKFPKLEFLGKNPNINDELSRDEMLKKARLLEDTLKSFGVEAKVNNISKGPTVTRFELTPSVGTRVNKIVSLEEDMALSLAAKSIRIEAPIPGMSAVGIELPNDNILSVYFSEILQNEKFQNFKSKLAFGIGKDITGNVIVYDIAKMPHLLVAGATGSGKSVCINTLITSILYKATPDEVKLIMVDPKVVELSVYNGIPHLLIPVVTDAKKASGALNWAVREMMRRYDLFATSGTRNLEGYNNKLPKEERLPQIVIIIDELADLMMVAKKEVEDSICRLAQLARAAGLHLIIATQRPSVDVITGIIKANIPSRIAFKVSSSTDSRTILDHGGAEKLLGRGDMLFKAVDMNKALRVQGAFVTDEEVETIVDYIKSDTPTYDISVIEEIEKAAVSDEDMSSGSSGGNDDLTDEVIDFIVKKGKASTSLIQRQFRIGFNKAARIVDELEERGIIGPENGSKPREVLMDKYEWQEYRQRQKDYI